jgi:hypothetical protein
MSTLTVEGSAYLQHFGRLEDPGDRGLSVTCVRVRRRRPGAAEKAGAR